MIGIMSDEKRAGTDVWRVRGVDVTPDLVLYATM